MLVSLIIGTLNRADYLKHCLESLNNQTYKDLEIIIINDGSTDDSIKILNEYSEKDKRIKIIDQENKGVSFSRNVGLDISTGELIAFVDADDEIDDEILNLKNLKQILIEQQMMKNLIKILILKMKMKNKKFLK